MARDKILRWARIYCGGYDLSGDALTFAQALSEYQEIDMTVWNDAVMKYLSNDRLRVGITGFQALLNDDAGRAFAVLKDPPNSLNVTLCLGSGAAPAFGDPAYHVPAITVTDIAGLDNQRLTVGPINFIPEAGAVGSNLLKPWGVILQAATSISATATGDSVDGGAGSTDGYHAMIQILATDSGDYEFTIEHSSNDVDWATLGTFTLDGSAVGSEFLSASGTVNQYVRAVSTRTAGDVTALITFVRN